MPSQPPWALVLDFDGTITLRDVADSLLLNYRAATPKDIAASYAPSAITEAWVEQQFRRLGVSREAMRSFALKTAKMRHGFDHLISHCKSSGTPVEIVSGGLDFYLDGLLEHWGFHWLPRFRAVTKQGRDGLRVRYHFLKGTTLDDFKRDRVLHWRKQGFRVAFAGDGTSDFQAARHADLAYATNHLMRLCRKAGVAAKPLTTFSHLRAALRP
jgi:2-hydroxy-3-keto-5-methylthiopentenyl-1-phosphate phosphatase